MKGNGRKAATKRTTSDVLVDRLLDWGVSVVFGLPGDGINGIMEALRERRDRIRFIQVRHEEAAAFMANMGAAFAALFVIEHLMYGAIVGALYGPVALPRPARAVEA